MSSLAIGIVESCLMQNNVMSRQAPQEKRKVSMRILKSLFNSTSSTSRLDKIDNRYLITSALLFFTPVAVFLAAFYMLWEMSQSRTGRPSADLGLVRLFQDGCYLLYSYGISQSVIAATVVTVALLIGLGLVIFFWMQIRNKQRHNGPPNTSVLAITIFFVCFFATFCPQAQAYEVLGDVPVIDGNAPVVLIPAGQSTQQPLVYTAMPKPTLRQGAHVLLSADTEEGILAALKYNKDLLEYSFDEIIVHPNLSLAGIIIGAVVLVGGAFICVLLYKLIQKCLPPPKTKLTNNNSDDGLMRLGDTNWYAGWFPLRSIIEDTNVAAIASGAFELSAEAVMLGATSHVSSEGSRYVQTNEFVPWQTAQDIIKSLGVNTNSANVVVNGKPTTTPFLRYDNASSTIIFTNSMGAAPMRTWTIQTTTNLTAPVWQTVLKFQAPREYKLTVQDATAAPDKEFYRAVPVDN